MIRLENVLKISLQDVLKTSWRCLEDVFARRLEDVLKTSWRRLEDVWTRRIYWSWPRRLEDVLRTSSEDVWLIRIYSSSSRRLLKTKVNNVFKTSSTWRMFAGFSFIYCFHYLYTNYWHLLLFWVHFAVTSPIYNTPCDNYH